MAAAPDPAIAIDLFARGLVAAQRLRLGTSERLRLAALRERLIAQGIAPDDSRIPQWLAAALCRSPAERAHLIRMLVVDTPLADNRQPAPRQMAEEPARTGTATTEPRRRRRRWAIVAASVLLASVLAVLAFAMLQPQTPQETPTPAPTATAGLEPSSAITQLPLPQAMPRTTTEYHPDGAAISALAIPPLVALGYVLIERRRRRQIRRKSAPAPQRALTLAFAAGPQGLLSDVTVRRTLRRLRRHRAVPCRTLDIPATIRATIAAGGRPEFRTGTRPESPQYLLLVERESPRDHIAWFGSIIAGRMRDEQIAHAHFEFLGDPRRLRPIATGSAVEMESLADVTAQHERADMVVVAESADWRADDAAPGWSELATLSQTVALLDPRERALWGRDALAAERMGMDVFPLGTVGLSDYADRLADMPAARGAPNRKGYDLPASLAANREALIGGTPPDPVIAEGLIDDLGDWLDPAGFDWLCAVALFPYVDPGLTVHLGATLTDARGTPLLDEARFLRLARLPWMREGSMPDWLRTALVRKLSPARLSAATAAIQAFLVPQVDGATRIDVGLSDDRRVRMRLLDWLRHRPMSVFSDRLLIDALVGRTPDRLGVEVSKDLRERLARLWAGHAARATGMALVAMIGISILAPPYPGTQMPVSTPDTPQPTPTVPPVTPPTASPTPTQQAQPSTVYIQYASADELGQARRLQAALVRRGVAAPRIENRGSASPDQFEIRYKAGQEAMSAWLMALASDAVGAVPVARLNPPAYGIQSATTLEIWFPRGGLSGSTGGGWGDAVTKRPPAKALPRKPSAESPAPPSTVTSDRANTMAVGSSTTPTRPNKAGPNKAGPNKAGSNVSPRVTIPLSVAPAATPTPVPAPSDTADSLLFAGATKGVSVDYTTASVIAFYADPPEQNAIDQVTRAYQAASDKMGKLAVVNDVAPVVTIRRSSGTRRGYDTDLKAALVKAGVPDNAVRGTQGVPISKRFDATSGMRQGRMQISMARQTLAQVSIAVGEVRISEAR